MRIHRCGIAGLLALAAFIACPAQSNAQAVQARKGMVVCVSPDAADVGVEILKRGGNAVDAAVAVALAMAVTYPPAGNIGGGGFMLVYPGGGKDPIVFEYRETAPRTVKSDTFANDKNDHTHKVVGVPGTVRGLELGHKHFGKLPWKDVVMPAVKLAEEGFILTPPMARSLNAVLKTTKDNAEFQRCFGNPNGR